MTKTLCYKVDTLTQSKGSSKLKKYWNKKFLENGKENWKFKLLVNGNESGSENMQ
jgi:hypothetical protein